MLKLLSVSRQQMDGSTNRFETERFGQNKQALRNGKTDPIPLSIGKSIIGVQLGQENPNRWSTVSIGRKRLVQFPTATVDTRVGIFLSTMNINDRFFFSHAIAE